jgi:glycosyltransferase involved in cell wall biosynthesis
VSSRRRRPPGDPNPLGPGAHVLFLIENQPYPYDPRVRAQAKAFAALGCDVTVAGPTGAGFEGIDETVDGVRVLRFRAPAAGQGFVGYLREFVVSLLRLWRIVRRVHAQRPVDLVVVCGPPDLLSILALPFARSGSAVMFDNRELSPELFETKFARRGPLYRALLWSERWAFQHADSILVTNQSYASNAWGRGGVDAKAVFVVGNGPDPARIFAVEPVPELRHGRDHLVLWMGAMSKQEGLERLLDAAGELVNDKGRTDVTFALVGPGDVVEVLNAQIERQGLGDFVELPGRVDDSLVRAYMATAAVCVAVDEPTTMNDRAAMRKVLEYMTMGRAVVQFPLQEMRRLCGDSTLYADIADPHDLPRKIEELLDDPDRRRALGQAARRRVEEQRLLWPDQIPTLEAAATTARNRAVVRLRKGR